MERESSLSKFIRDISIPSSAKDIYIITSNHSSEYTVPLVKILSQDGFHVNINDQVTFQETHQPESHVRISIRINSNQIDLKINVINGPVLMF